MCDGKRTSPWKALPIIALCWTVPTVNSFGVDPSCRRRRPFSPFRTNHGGSLFDSVRQNRKYCNHDLIIRPWKDDSTTITATTTTIRTIRTGRSFSLSAASASEDDSSNHPTASGSESKGKTVHSHYDLGVGKHAPVQDGTLTNLDRGDPTVEENDATTTNDNDTFEFWTVPEPVHKPIPVQQTYNLGAGKHLPVGVERNNEPTDMTTRKTMLAKTQEDQFLSGAIWDVGHFESALPRKPSPREKTPPSTSTSTEPTTATTSNGDSSSTESSPPIESSCDDTLNEATHESSLVAGNANVATSNNANANRGSFETDCATATAAAAAAAMAAASFIKYEDIDLSIPLSVYDPPGVDLVWDLMQVEARREAEREPLLVSFLHSTILNHYSLESALAFHLANRLSSPAMISTQVMSLIREALDESPVFRRSLRADIMAVRDRDPACTCLPDVFLYFKGFHALQTHRVAHYLWQKDRRVLAHYLQSQVSQNFQIDIHPNATMGSGIMLDHGTGIVIGETATVGHNCSILHHVTLGGSGKKGVDRHPKVGSGVLLGAGASVLGNVRIGDGCQVGAGTLVISDLPDHSVAVGVPAKIIGSFVDVSAQPSIGMNQILNQEDASIVTFETGGI